MNQNLFAKHGGRLVAALCVAGAVAYVALVFAPRAKSLAQLTQQLEQRRAAAAVSSQTLTEVAQVTRELEEAKHYAAAWSAAAPRREQLISLLRDINQLAQKSQTRNLRLDPGRADSWAALWRTPVNLVVEGSFAQLWEFVGGLEAISPAVALSSVQLERVEGDVQSLRMTATLTILGAKPEFSNYVSLAE